MKKLIALLLSVCLILCLFSACGSKETAAEEPEEATEAPAEEAPA